VILVGRRRGDELDDYAIVPARIHRVYLSAGPSGIRRIYGTASRDLVWLGISELLEKFGSRLDRCDAEGCQRLFVRERAQKYSSISRGGAVRYSRWYALNKEKARRRRHDAYIRRKIRG